MDVVSLSVGVYDVTYFECVAPYGTSLQQKLNADETMFMRIEGPTF